MIGTRLIKRQKNSINICYLIDVAPEKFRGGGQTHLINLIDQMQVQSANWRTNIKYQIFSAKKASTLFRLWWMILVIPQVIFYHCFKDRFGLIHAHSIPAIVAGKVLSAILRIPVVVTVHGYNEKRWMEKFVLTKIKYGKQITVARNFLKYPNVNRAIYIPNGVDLQKYKKVQKSTKKYKKEKVVLFVGRKKDPVKGYKILEDAMKIVKNKIPDAELLVMDGSYSQEDVINAYRRADLFVLPSLSEGFPLTLLEAWAAKLPVIATRVGEVPYLIRNGINGYLIPSGDLVILFETIVKTLKLPRLKKLGEEGYKTASSYTWKAVAERTLKVYNSTLYGVI